MKKLQRFYEKIEKNKLTKLILIAVAHEWIEQHDPEFVKKDEWPPNSSGIKPLDYHVWGKRFERYKVLISKKLGSSTPSGMESKKKEKEKRKKSATWRNNMSNMCSSPVLSLYGKKSF